MVEHELSRALATYW